MVSYGAGWLIGWPVLVPAFNTLAAFPFMAVALRVGRVRQAIGLMLLWAAVMGVCATLLSYARTSDMDRLIVNGEAYRGEMFSWLLTGQGAESDAARFVPQHLWHLALFSGLSIVSGSVLSMPMGAVLMNYMGHYVGSLAAASAEPLPTMLLGWHPWAVIRIVSYVVLGVLLAGPVWKSVARFDYRLRDHARLFVLAGAGVIADIGLKWALAAQWRELIVRTAGW